MYDAISLRVLKLAGSVSVLFFLFTGASSALGAVHYVDLNSTNPTPPFTNWATAAQTIQDAVDLSESGELVLVTGGVYDVGGGSSRVSIYKAVRVESLMGPEATLIVGSPSHYGTNGEGAIRCVDVGANAILSGFTLTNGHTLVATRDDAGTVRGGGAWCHPWAVLTNCVITGNSAWDDGAGVYGGTLYNCTLANNHGGGNDADGGGADHATLYQCKLTGNSGRKGGAADDSTLYSCVLAGNKARVRGGGAARSVLYNCTILDNTSRRGGGVSECTVYNGIVYSNRAVFSENYDGSSFSHSCTTPLPAVGPGNIDLDPQMSSWSHLSANSPCIGAGSAEFAVAVDIDGESVPAPPCMGADQLVPGGAIGPLSVVIESRFANLTVGFEAPFRAQIEGQTSANRWEFGDGTVLSNRLEAVHVWHAPGVYDLRLTAFNDAHPAGVPTTVSIQVVETVPVAHVDWASSTPASPYATWATAAKNIQDAIGASAVAGRLVLVTNGVYDMGGAAVWGLMTNRIALLDGVIVRSVHGPAVTIISGLPAPNGGNGNGAIRCAYVGDGSVLEGFTLVNGHTRTSGHLSREQGGGGAWCEQSGVVRNCIFTQNEASRDGGGANGGIFHGCVFRANRAGDEGGGADDAVLYQCTLTGNLANESGGVSESRLHNSIIYYNTNTAEYFDPNHGNSALWYCCTTHAYGPGSITIPPAFSNLRLESNSPCINAGANLYASGGTDLDGNLRIRGGTVDIGAYEFQSPESIISYAWLQRFGLPTDGTADYADADADGHNNWQEWRCQTDPTSANSALRLLSAMPAGSNVAVTWQSVVGVSYFLEGSTGSLAGSSFTAIATNLTGQGAYTIYTNKNTATTPRLFYRVGVEH